MIRLEWNEVSNAENSVKRLVCIISEALGVCVHVVWFDNGQNCAKNQPELSKRVSKPTKLARDRQTDRLT